MGNIIVGIIIIAVVLNGIRVFRKQLKRMKGRECTGNCDTCKTPCEVKFFYNKDSTDSD